MRSCGLKGMGACLFIFLLFCVPDVYASSHSYVLAQNTEGQAYYRETEISKFSSREDAEKLAGKLRSGGFETVIRTDVTGGETVYRVFVLVHDRTSGTGTESQPKGKTEEERTGMERPEGRPPGTSMSAEDLFGRSAGYFHPSLTLSEEYTDNAFYTKDNKKSNWSTVLSPEIWLALPRINQKYLDFEDTSNRFPGGLIVGTYRPEVVRRYQTYLLYRADIPLTVSKNSPSGNTVSHNAYGGIFYNGNIFSADVNDQFTRSYETRGVSVSTQEGEVDRYNSNLFNLVAHLDTGNRLKFALGYSNFVVDYDASRNDFRDRMDNGFAGYIFYRLKPKTAIFAEYDFLNIDYRNDETADSREHHFFGGLQWDITAKSRGVVKAGYALKDFSDVSEKANDFVCEARVSHYFSPRTSVTFTALRKTTESDVSSALFAVTNEVGVNYRQILTSRITGLAELFYINDKYKGSPQGATDTENLDDDTYQAGVGLQYEFQKRIKSSIGYTYAQRKSNFHEFDYTSNTFYFRITGAL